MFGVPRREVACRANSFIRNSFRPSDVRPVLWRVIRGTRLRLPTDSVFLTDDEIVVSFESCRKRASTLPGKSMGTDATGRGAGSDDTLFQA